MRRLFAVAAGLVLTAAVAPAQTITNRPIDTTNLVVRPADTLTGFLGGATRMLSRSVAGTIENNGFVRTINNLFGTTRTPRLQSNGTLDPAAYPSTRYPNSFQPVMPTTGRAPGR